MNPLPDRVVIVVIAATIGICFALAFWSVRLQPARPQLQWRDGTTAATRWHAAESPMGLAAVVLPARPL